MRFKFSTDETPNCSCAEYAARSKSPSLRSITAVGGLGEATLAASENFVIERNGLLLLSEIQFDRDLKLFFHDSGRAIASRPSASSSRPAVGSMRTMVKPHLSGMFSKERKSIIAETAEHLLDPISVRHALTFAPDQVVQSGNIEL